MKCRYCKGTNLAYGQSLRGATGIADGRHRIGEIQVIFYLFCQECDATLQNFVIDEILDILDGVMDQTVKANFICQVGHVNERLITCGAAESGGFICEEQGDHKKHRIGWHTIEHSLIGNGFACSAVVSINQKAPGWVTQPKKKEK